MPRKPRSLEEVRRLVFKGDSHAFYVSPYWKAKRLKILERDNYCCQRCLNKFIHEKPLERVVLTRAKYVHHIIPLLENFDLALEDDNLISLCFQCHEAVEGRVSFILKPKKKRLTDEKW